MKVVCEKVIAGQTRLLSGATTPGGNQAAKVLTIVGAGNPFYAWETVPPGRIIGCDFGPAPICAATAAEVADQIAGIQVSPEDVLTYA